MAETIASMAHSYGARLKFSTTGVPGSYTEVDNLIDVDSPSLERGKIPSSSLTTPQKVKYKKPGWIEPGDNNFKISATAAGLATLYQHFLSGAELYWYIVFGETYTAGVDLGSEVFMGFISRFHPSQTLSREQDENVEAEMTICVTRLGKNPAGGDAANFFEAGTGTL